MVLLYHIIGGVAMPYEIIRQDITKMKVDAIVNPTDYMFSGSGGTDARIHFAAGPELRAACDALQLLKESEVAVTEGFRLPCKYIIHTFGPVWQGGMLDERKKLASCYRNALETANELGCKSIAFPLIASGTFGFPKDQVLRIALDTITNFLMSHDMMVYLLVYDKKAYEISKKLLKDIDSFIDEHYIDRHRLDFDPYTYTYTPKEPSGKNAEEIKNEIQACRTSVGTVPSLTTAVPNLEAMLAEKHESFSDALLRLITESGMTDAECYKKANITKQHFSKIRSNVHYQPTKQTVLAFAVVLKLTLEDTKQLLNKAGLALNPNDKTDIIVEYFIISKKYDLIEINEVLYQYDQKCLGNVIA